MADELIPLNAFKSVVATLTGEEDQVYNHHIIGTNNK
jgi:hypothetical protein